MTDQLSNGTDTVYRLGITDAEAEHYRKLIDAAMRKLLANGEYRTEIGMFGINVYVALYNMGRGGFSVAWTDIRYLRGSDSVPLSYVRTRLEDTITVIARDMYMWKATE